jgi:signal transduction histidine kinase
LRWSIRYRLFVPLGLLLLGVVGISAWSAIASARQAEERIARKVRGVTLTPAIAKLTPNQAILEQMKGLSGAEYLYIDPDGNRLATFRDRNVYLPPEIETQVFEEDAADQLGLPIDVEDKRYRCRRLPQSSGGNFFIFYPEESLNEEIRVAVRPSLVFGLGGGIVAVLVMFLIGQRLVGRIRALERRTRQIAAGDFSPMPLPTQMDELRDLAQSVNDMAERLADLQETVQRTERLRLLGQVSSGLAHQLRNAVTGAKLAVQLHASECPLKDDESLQVTLRQLSLMEANLRRFMNVGKVEPPARSRCSIGKLIDEAITLLHPQCKHAGIEIRHQTSEASIELEGDAGQLRDLILNLLGNAMEAAGPRGMVEVSSSMAPGDRRAAIVEIADSGVGPPPEIASRLFEPFVTGKPEGVGLGLAVSRQAVEAHGGSIAWRREQGRTIFRVDLPLTA